MAPATSAPVRVREHRFGAMGSDAHLVVVDGADGDALVQAGVERITELERRWSRFSPDSEVSRLNAADGSPVAVSADTIALVERSVLAWERTSGRFDPTVGAALIALGYDRDFAEVAAGLPRGTDLHAAPGLRGVRVDHAASSVALPAGMTFDPGGIGKGFAADLTVHHLRELGADGALVSLGGDLVAAGEAPVPEGWVVNVPHPLTRERDLLAVAIPHGAVATSTRLKRRWSTRAGTVHHLIDPATGRPMSNRVVAVTVVAAEGWWADALTKALFLTGPEGLRDCISAHAAVVLDDGTCHTTPDLQGVLR